MEQLFLTLLSGELTVTALLLIFIIALLTKRFVPWWTYEEMQARLKLYEKEAPDLIKEVQNLLDAIDKEEERESTTYSRRRPHGNSRNRSKKGGSDDNPRISS